MTGFEILNQLFSLGEGAVLTIMGVFIRVGAAVALLPGFGEQTLPLRLRLAAAIAFTIIVWPLTGLSPPQQADMGAAMGVVFASEAAAGLLIGLAVRLMIMALQLAGSIAAQATSVSQIFGANVTPDPMPAMGNVLVMAGLALSLTLGLHVKIAASLAESYRVIPFGVFAPGADVAQWGLGRASAAFSLAFSLAAPFVIAALAYNVMLGAINRAMPQLMVAFIGAPFITAGALLILFLIAPSALLFWAGALDRTLDNPFGPAR